MKLVSTAKSGTNAVAFSLLSRCWLSLIFLLSTVTLGCKVGPNHAPPVMNLKPTYSLANHPRLQGQPANPREWWRYFNDPVLTSNIEVMLNQNLTLREACQRIAESRARLGIAKGNLFPQVQTANGAYSKSRLSSNTANFFSFPGVFEPNLNPENYYAGFNASWELDFWGRYSRAIESADASLGVAIAAYDEATVLLLAEFATTYVAMRTMERRLEIASQNLETQRRTLEIAKQKKEGGLASGMDVAQAATNYGQTGALLPVLEVSRRHASHRLCVLLGREPIDLAQEWGPTAQIPRPDQDLAFGIPADLVRRRPDVRKAERELAAQSARIGVAESDFYPHISINGNIGVAAEDVNRLFRSNSTVGLISPQFSWNILNYGRIRNNVEAEKAAFNRLAFAYRASVLNAVREAEDAQVSLVYAFERANWLDLAAKAARDAVEKAETSFREGATDFGRVYVLQAELLRQQDNLANTEAEIASSLISIFRATGGGWEVRQREIAILPPVGNQPTFPWQ